MRYSAEGGIPLESRPRDVTKSRAFCGTPLHELEKNPFWNHAKRIFRFCATPLYKLERKSYFGDGNEKRKKNSGVRQASSIK